MSDDLPPTPPVEKRADGRFVKGDPRRSSGGAMRRTRDGKSLTKMAREHTEAGFNKLIEILNDPTTSKKDLLTAITILFNRGWGLANQQIRVEGEVQHTHAQLDPTLLTFEAREQILAAYRQTFTVQPTMIEASPTISEGDDDR